MNCSSTTTKLLRNVVRLQRRTATPSNITRPSTSIQDQGSSPPDPLGIPPCRLRHDDGNGSSTIIFDVSSSSRRRRASSSMSISSSTENLLRRRIRDYRSYSSSPLRRLISTTTVNDNNGGSCQSHSHDIEEDHKSLISWSKKNKELMRLHVRDPLISGSGSSSGGGIGGINLNARSVVTSQKLVEEISPNRMEDHQDKKLMTKEESEEFNAMFPQLVKDLTELPQEYRDMGETNQWFARVLQYNVPHGKKNRGLMTSLAYRYLAKNGGTEEGMRLSYVLGWLVEMLQAYFLVADDIMDGSETRRGRPCWYKIENIGSSGFNDALLLQSSIFFLLKKYFRNKPYYADLVDVMHDVDHKTIYGQSLDTRTGIEKKLETYTMERYTSIVKYKTSFYSFYLPIRLAMVMVGMNDSEVVDQVRTVTLQMGHFFQVQDDFLDCFGDESVTGKIGTDIQDSKCSWLFVIASEKCTPAQKEVLWKNYGKHEQEKVEIVKKLYQELGLEETYGIYEEQTYKLICAHIRQMSEKIPKQLFYEFVNKIYKRSS